ncbi:MAG TPA: DUF2937 family protein [Alphaproteobacteria bacterium]|nr:DUF2937 family protein [Alphaproteobacteria bacterium]
MVRWVGRKVDSLIAAMFAAALGVAASQVLAFVQQYLQRLGGHLDEASRTLLKVQTGEAFPTLGPEARRQVADELLQRVHALDAADQAIRHAGPLGRPVAFVMHLDPEIARSTLDAFEPALPLDAASLAYAAAGLFIGWLAWELVKAPVAWATRPARRPKR